MTKKREYHKWEHVPLAYMNDSGYIEKEVSGTVVHIKENGMPILGLKECYDNDIDGSFDSVALRNEDFAKAFIECSHLFNAYREFMDFSSMSDITRCEEVGHSINLVCPDGSTVDAHIVYQLETGGYILMVDTYVDVPDYTDYTTISKAFPDITEFLDAFWDEEVYKANGYFIMRPINDDEILAEIRSIDL